MQISHKFLTDIPNENEIIIDQHTWEILIIGATNHINYPHKHNTLYTTKIKQNMCDNRPMMNNHNAEFHFTATARCDNINSKLATR